MPRRSRKQPPPPLHELEAEVMEEMWRQEKATTRDVLEALNRQTRKQRAYTTVLTVMVRLDRKGLLRRRRRGNADVYSPTMTRESYLEQRARAEVGDLVKEYGDLALAHFARQVESLDAKRLRQLRKLAGDD